MASSSPIKDLKEIFFLCSVCSDQFKEPKLLPCLHRYCRDCLDKIIQAGSEGTFKCPICKKTFETSDNGVDGFKTDFHMKSMLEFKQLQKSFEKKDLKECGSCVKKLMMCVYCFKCREFLCDQCGQYHNNNRLFRDHKHHIVKLEYTENKKSMVGKLKSLTQNPICNHHVEQEALLCCGTCGNIPVCIICVYGKHKGHDLHDVTEEAERQRESLKIRLLDINQHKDKLYDLPKVIDKSMKKLRENVKNESEKINIEYEQQAEKIKDRMKQWKMEREKSTKNVNKRREKEINEIRRKHEEEMKQVEGKYDEEFNKADEKYDKIMKGLQRKLESLDSNLKELTSEKDEMAKQNETELQKVSEYCEQFIKRYENLTVTTSSIISSNDKWTDAQCIPDIRTASELLEEEMRKGFPELESLSNFEIDNLSNILVDVVVITNEYESVIDVEGFKAKGCGVNSVTNMSNGNMVITGRLSSGYSHITEINRNGKIQWQDKIIDNDSYSQNRYCWRLSEFKVASVSHPSKVGIYDVCNGSYISRNIQEVISYGCQWVTCVTTDPVNNHIIVGTRSRELYLFDDQLNYIKTIKLPDAVRTQVDICVHEGNLLVCSDTGSAYAVTLEGTASHVMYEFTKPDIDGGDWIPSSVCTDKHGFIYMIRQENIYDQGRSIFVQYSKDGRQILKQIPLIDINANCMTTIEQNDTELLVFSACNTGKLYTYKLLEK